LITSLIGKKLGHRCHWAVADYLQRSARHVASETDVEQAYAIGRAAVEFAIAGRNAVMPAIRRISDSPYRWEIIEAPLSAVANQEKLLPPEFVSADGFGITRSSSQLFGTAHRWRSLSAIQEWSPRLCATAERGDAKETNESVCHMKPNKTPLVEICATP
jgi:hypothetical protein